MDTRHRNDGGSVTLTLTAEGADLARRLLFADAVDVLTDLAGRLADLRDLTAPTAIDVADARSAVRLLRDNLDALDALGWPEGTPVEAVVS